MDKMKQWVALGVLAAVAIVAAGWFLLVSPKKQEASDLNAQADSISAQNATLRNELAVLKEQAKELPRERAALQAASIKLPNNPELPGLIRAISKVSEESNVTFVSLTPAEPDIDDAPANTFGQLNRIPVDLTVVGGYYEIQRMIRKMEELPRAYRVVNLVLAPGSALSDSGEAIDDGRRLETILSGEIFMVTPPGTPASPGVASAAAGPLATDAAAGAEVAPAAATAEPANAAPVN